MVRCNMPNHIQIAMWTRKFSIPELTVCNIWIATWAQIGSEDPTTGIRPLSILSELWALRPRDTSWALLHYHGEPCGFRYISLTRLKTRSTIALCICVLFKTSSAIALLTAAYNNAQKIISFTSKQHGKLAITSIRLKSGNVQQT